MVGVAGEVVPVGREEETASRIGHVARRCQPERLLRQVGGPGRRAARVSRLRCVLEDRGGRAIRLGRREREVASPFLDGRSGLGKPRVQTVPARRRQAYGDRRSQQRMGESDPLPVQLEDACRDALCQPRLVTGADHRLHERDRRLGERCDRGGDLERVGSDAVQTHAQELVEAGRNREILSGCERAAAALERGRKLEREERVAARGLPELDQHRPRERRVEAVVQELVRRAEAQAADTNRSQPVVGDRAANPLGNVVAHREQGGDLLVVEACDRIPKCRERGRVQPLDVVDREAESAVGGEQAQRAEERSGHRAGVGGELRLAQQQSGLERPSLDRRQLGQDLGCDLAEDVRQRQEREPRLRLRGPRRQDTKSAGVSVLDPGEPQCRLADPGLAGDHGDRWQLLGRVDEIEECC